ncbi:hypothetical protein Tco_1546242 [Tanacetum coccineum]
MDLFAFICHSDPTKVRIGERDLVESEVKLLKMTEGRTVSLDPPVIAASGDRGDSVDKLFDEGNDTGQEHSIERDDDVLEKTVAKDASEVVAEKAKKKQKKKVVGDVSGSTFPPKRLREDYHAGASSTGGKSLATICDLVPDGSSVLSGVTEPPTVVSMPPTPDGGPTDSVSMPNLRVCPPSLRYVVSSDDSHRSSSCSEIKSFARSLAKDVLVTTVAVTTTVTADVSIIPPPRVRVVSKNLEIVVDSTSAGGVNADVAGTSKLNEPGRTAGVSWCGERDAETVHQKSLLSLKEAEAAEAICLHGQLTVVEAADTAKGGELGDLKEKNFTLEGERDVMSDKIATLESANVAKEVELASLSSQVAKLTSDLFGFQLSRDEFDSKVEAYDPSAEAKYIDAVNALGAVDFSLLSELESKKDSSIVDLMDSLRLEGEALVAHRCLTGEASTSAAPITTLSTTFASSDVVLPTSVVSDQVLDVKPHNEDPPAVTFEKEEIGTSPE